MLKPLWLAIASRFRFYRYIHRFALTMRSFFGPVLVAALAAVSSVQAAPYPFNAPQHDVTSLHIRSSNISAELGPLLSNGSSIFTQDDPRFANATDRYQAYKPPQFSVVVEPATEKDIATIVSRS